ncbi:GDSL esterase/lipase [Rhynchospora pubera]|uniref:GDSL esterase/lipase n=1 Tax=Rhynchospora pubera TaxID=906938 RepID=A0AAV8FRA3_9POAL|nr:GDSL esterase/lipase [Rhynchospora pubera]
MKISLPCFLFILLQITHAHNTDQPFNAIWSFGNSLADTGNFIVLARGVLPYDVFEHLPYGVTYFGQPTGRASDGRLVIDIIAQTLGLPLVPPYLSQGQNFSRGVNFAVIGAPALGMDFFQRRNITGFLPTDTSLNVQLSWFVDKVKHLLCNTTQSCLDYFKRSLFLLGEFGGNDYNLALFAGKSVSEAKSYIPFVIDIIRQTAESLLKQGALHIVIPGNFPTGCIPILLTIFASNNKLDYDNLGCLKEYNTIGFDHDMKLKEMVAQLQNKYPQAKIIYADYYEPVIQFLQNPSKFGFTVSDPLQI